MRSNTLIRTKIVILKTYYYILEFLSNFKKFNKYVLSHKLHVGSILLTLSVVYSSCNINKTIQKSKNTLEGDIKNQEKELEMFLNEIDIETEENYCYDPAPPLPKAHEKDTLIIVEQMPDFPGGKDSLYIYISNSIVYPHLALLNKIEGKVYVGFVVTNKGEIADIKILKGLHPELDNEAIRIIQNMPKWIPGKQNGVETNVKYVIPVHFKLPNEK